MDTPPDAPADAIAPANVIEWVIAPGLTDYPAALAAMEQRVEAIRAGTARERIWLVEHPPLYTAGTSAAADELLAPGRFPVYDAGRGGRFTYHGPGQRVVYVMLDLAKHGRDLRDFVCKLEKWVIAALARFNVTGEMRDGRVGVWVARGEAPFAREDKIAAIGVRVRRWVTFHGLSLNVEPDLGHFTGIVPCGISAHGVTSLVDLGLPVTMADVDIALLDTFEDVFGLPLVHQSSAAA
ncbi:lipoyl(octanoyl) transferase LipB [Zavarzinia compransoris]|uniref:Octanoyltransferase n=1 Tax=Zavarzinia compransoris TaxID=1264899 RepID=A0A317DTJ7_9PROT|nr:lipoyl(octanoyl) transferase LipB [Zavarzinia compransoris]PWR18017.1 lipoate-protein ligase B [Zavarzinia compransoris]TDP43518.1 lipoyl(octanoyl) transferase [Zavarzinia compransoris]